MKKTLALLAGAAVVCVLAACGSVVPAGNDGTNDTGGVNNPPPNSKFGPVTIVEVKRERTKVYLRWMPVQGAKRYGVLRINGHAEPVGSTRSNEYTDDLPPSFMDDMVAYQVVPIAANGEKGLPSSEVPTMPSEEITPPPTPRVDSIVARTMLLTEGEEGAWDLFDAEDGEPVTPKKMNSGAGCGAWEEQCQALFREVDDRDRQNPNGGEAFVQSERDNFVLVMLSTDGGVRWDGCWFNKEGALQLQCGGFTNDLTMVLGTIHSFDLERKRFRSDLGFPVEGRPHVESTADTQQ